MRSCPSPHACTSLALSLAVVAALGCSRDEITVYEVPKEAPVIARPTGGMGMGGAAMAAPADGRPPRFELPAGWVSKEASGMRLASISAGEGDAAVDISIIRLTGDGGGLAANFNRWRQQVNLPPEDTRALTASLTRVKIAGADGHQALLLEGPPEGKAILGAVLFREGASWFFKMGGNTPAVKAQAAAFDQWIASIQFDAGSPAANPAAPQGGGAQAPADDGQAPDFDVPAGWARKEASGMRLASLSAGEGDAAVDVSIIRLTGDGGGLAANFNRWRQQVGLPPEGDEALTRSLTPVKIAGADAHKALLLEGPQDGKAILGAVLLRQGASWFFKMSGKTPAVKAQAVAFDQWIGSVRFGGAAAPPAAATETANPHGGDQ